MPVDEPQTVNQPESAEKKQIVLEEKVGEAVTDVISEHVDGDKNDE